MDRALCEEVVRVHGECESFRRSTLLRLAEGRGGTSSASPLVWAKFKGYPWWPAQLVELSMQLPVTAAILKRLLAGWQPQQPGQPGGGGGEQVLAAFYGPKREYSWMPPESVRPFEKFRAELAPRRAKGNKHFKAVMQAVRQADEALHRGNCLVRTLGPGVPEQLPEPPPPPPGPSAGRRSEPLAAGLAEGQRTTATAAAGHPESRFDSLCEAELRQLLAAIAPGREAAADAAADSQSADSRRPGGDTKARLLRALRLAVPMPGGAWQ
jgi:hypothetical protein